MSRGANEVLCYCNTFYYKNLCFVDNTSVKQFATITEHLQSDQITDYTDKQDSLHNSI